MPYPLDSTAVWNRAADGAADGMRPGDVALAYALEFHGIAEGDGFLTAVEEATETEFGLEQAISGFDFYGLADVSTEIRSLRKAWVVALKADDEAKISALEGAADEKYGDLNVEERLSRALESKMREDPGAFQQFLD